MDDRETAVTISAECGVETRQKLGVLWPSAIYKAHVGVDPKPDQLSKISIGGTLISGVLRDASHGCPTGGAGLQTTVYYVINVIIRLSHALQTCRLRLAW